MKALADRFEEKVSVGWPSGCWLWTGALNGVGYGKISIGVRGEGTRDAHRVAWELFRGVISKQFSVLHKCDVRSCVNPEHLFLGTHHENMYDMRLKGRQSNRRVTEELVIKIRSSGKSSLDIQREFGLSQGCVTAILSRKTWKHIL